MALSNLFPALRLVAACHLFTLLPLVLARCPFAHVLSEGEPPAGGRHLLKSAPPLCNIAALIAAGPYIPPGPTYAPGEVDRRVKEIAWSILTAGSPPTAGFAAIPGMGSPGSPNTDLKLLGSLLRLAFHDAGTFNRTSKSGGANGSVRLELIGIQTTRALKDAATLCDLWRAAINAKLAVDPQVPIGVEISYADVCQLAGAVAVIVTGGPSTAALWEPLPVGRVDNPPYGASVPQDDLAVLPDKHLDIIPLECLFLRNGYTLKELVALSGAHTIGFQQQGTAGNKTLTPLTPTPHTFNNDYFNLVLKQTALIHTDNQLNMASATKTLVKQFAADQASFHKAFAVAYLKMSKMGATWKSYGATLLSAQ